MAAVLEPVLEVRKRAGALVRSLEGPIRDAWSRREELGAGVSDPVIVVVEGENGNADPAATAIVIRSAAELSADVRALSPGLAAHLLHIDTNDGRILVLMGSSVMLIGDGGPCEACRLAALAASRLLN